jgi:hypothetical protein
MLLSVYEADITQPLTVEPLPRNYYNLITCFFALHYCFATTSMARGLLSRVAESLHADGGILVCVIPDEWQVRSFYERYTSADGLSSHPLCTVRFVDSKSYFFSLRDSITDCLEHIVEESVLLDTMATFAVECVMRRVPLCSITTRNNTRRELSEAEQEVSSLYAVYVFRKTRTL